jgi:carboxymethylenebutenolidase
MEFENEQERIYRIKLGPGETTHARICPAPRLTVEITGGQLAVINWAVWRRIKSFKLNNCAGHSFTEELTMSDLSPSQQALMDLFQQHVNAELEGDIETTMATMTDHPHLNHVPVMTGGVGREGVRRFYSDHLVGKFFPPDVEMISVSRTVGEDQIAEELIIRFTHTMAIDWMLPGVQPTGRRVETAVAVIIKFEGGKIAHEHIYWDQASVLVQLGLLNAAGLPVSGAESARKVLDPSLPSREI